MGEKKVIVVGSGFSGLSVATSLAHKGYQVTVLEKNDTPGGRARSFSAHGFTFDMGPSWYWMPDVFDQYFESLGYKTADLYQLQRLDPSYTIVFDQHTMMEVPANMQALLHLFESLEAGSSKKLEKFLAEASYKYEVGMNNLVYKPSRSPMEFLSLKLLYGILRMDVFKSFDKHIRTFFRHPQILQMMEFPILLLGALPKDTPALYSLMNYADIALGTWYPMGGMHKIVEGMVRVAQEQGVVFHYGEEVTSFTIHDNNICEVHTGKGSYATDVCVASADYHHVETALLPAEYRSYTDKYWNQRSMAPSSLLFYIGLNKKLKGLSHHTLFFDQDFGPHAKDIYENKRWPENPLFYLSITSKTDPSVAPEGCENLFILIPVAVDLEDNEAIREEYYQAVMRRLEKLTGQSVRDAVVFKRSYAHKDFISDYHAFKGNAYGLANTLMQTALLKPSLKSKKIDNLYYTGQLTVPGPGVPPSLISGRVVAEEVAREAGI